MLNKITAKGPLNFQSDLGQYNVLKKHLQLWFSSMALTMGEDHILIKDFEFPKDVKKLELIDTHSDLRMNVPVDDFKSVYINGIGYKFPFEEWKEKYGIKPVLY